MQRIVFYQTAYQLFVQKPLLGFGFATSYYATKSILGFNITLHSDYLTILVELGIIGLFIYLWLFSSICIKVFRSIYAFSEPRIKLLFISILSCVIAMLIMGIVDRPFMYMQIYLWAIMAIWEVNRRQPSLIKRDGRDG